MAGSLQCTRQPAAARDGTLTTGLSTSLVESEPQNSCERANSCRLITQGGSSSARLTQGSGHAVNGQDVSLRTESVETAIPARTMSATPARVVEETAGHRRGLSPPAIAVATRPRECVAAGSPAMALSPCSRRSTTSPSAVPDTHQPAHPQRNRPLWPARAEWTSLAAHRLWSAHPQWTRRGARPLQSLSTSPDVPDSDNTGCVDWRSKFPVPQRSEPTPAV